MNTMSGFRHWMDLTKRSDNDFVVLIPVYRFSSSVTQDFKISMIKDLLN